MPSEDLDDLLAAAEKLRINGLQEIEREVTIQLIEEESETKEVIDTTTSNKEDSKMKLLLESNSSILNCTTSYDLQCNYDTIQKIPKAPKYADRKFDCDECDYKATQSGNLTVHKKMKHLKLRFPCNVCSHESGSMGNLASHVKRRHGK